MKKIMGFLLLTAAALPGCGKKKKDTNAKVSAIEQVDKEIAANEKDLLLKDAIFEEGESFAFVNENTSKGVAASDNSDVALNDGDVEDADSAGFETVHFGFDTDKLKEKEQEVLHHNFDAAKKVLEEGKEVKVNAYACEIGETSYNMALSQRRADTIKKEMVSHGLDKEMIHAVGCGQENPVVRMADLSDEELENRSKRIAKLAPSRRAEFVVVAKAA